MRKGIYKVFLALVVMVVAILAANTKEIYAAGENTVKIVEQPKGHSVMNGETAKAAVKATGDGLTYQWYYTQDGKAKEFKKSISSSATYSTVMDYSKEGRKVYCVVTDKYGNKATSSTVTLENKDYLAVSLEPKVLYVDSVGTVKLQANVVSKGQAYTIVWYYKDKNSTEFLTYWGSNGFFYEFYMQEEYDGRQVYCTVVDEYKNSVTSEVITIKVKPEITNNTYTKSHSNGYAYSGEKVTITVNSVGEGLTYQWYYKDEGEKDYKKSIHTTKTYSTVMEPSKDGRKVYCQVTDKFGSTYTLNTLTFELDRSDFKITEEPKDVSVANGAKATVTVKAIGDALTYQWYYTDNAMSSVFHKSSNTGPTYTTTMADSKHGRKVYCVITNHFGQTITSKTVNIYRTGAVKLTKEISEGYGYFGEEESIKVSAEGEGLTYQWYYTPDATKPEFIKSSNTTDTYSVKLGFENNKRQVYCVVTDKNGIRIKTNIVRFSYSNNPVSIHEQPVDVTVHKDKTAKTTVVAKGVNLKYQWYYTENGSSDTFIRSGNTTETYSTIMNASRDGRKVYCVVKDEMGNVLTTETVTLNMAPELKFTKQPKSNYYFNKSGTQELTVEAVGEGVTYQWYYKYGEGNTGFTQAFGSGNSYTCSVDKSNPIKQAYCVIRDAYGMAVKSKVIICRSVNFVKITGQPQSNAFKVGTNAEISVKATGDGLKYQWYYTTNASDPTFYKSTCTTATYTTEMNKNKIGRKVYCVVTDPYGNSQKSETATLSEYKGMQIVAQPTNIKANCGEDYELTVKISGGCAPYKYCWMYDSAGTKNEVETVTSINKESRCERTAYSNDFRLERKYYCVITDAYGETLTTNKVKITPERLKITKQPKSISTELYVTKNFSVEVSGGIGELTYQWQQNKGGSNLGDWKDYGSEYKSLAGGKHTLSVYIGANIHYTDAFRCVISDDAGNTVISDVVTIRPVHTDFIITENLKSDYYYVNSDVKYLVTVEGGTPPYQFEWMTVMPLKSGLVAIVIVPSTKRVEGNASEIVFENIDSSFFEYTVYCKITDATGKTLTTNKVQAKQW